ncbi:hypothetical protein Hanom_Chr14g01335311 [Helianthus anomalus]
MKRRRHRYAVPPPLQTVTSSRTSPFSVPLLSLSASLELSIYTRICFFWDKVINPWYMTQMHKTKFKHKVQHLMLRNVIN